MTGGPPLSLLTMTHVAVLGGGFAGLRAAGDLGRIRGSLPWAAGVEALSLNLQLGGERGRQGRIHVLPDLSQPGDPEVFVAGNQAHSEGANGDLLPGIAPVAMQEGAYLARKIKKRVRDESADDAFEYRD